MIPISKCKGYCGYQLELSTICVHNFRTLIFVSNFSDIWDRVMEPKHLPTGLEKNKKYFQVKFHRIADM